MRCTILKQYFYSLLFFTFCSCTRNGENSLTLSPETPYSTWSPLKGNQLISSNSCKILLPQNFDQGETSLAELLDIALLNNPKTKKTWANARAAAAQYGQSMSVFYPKITSSSSFVRQKGSFSVSHSSSEARRGIESNSLSERNIYATQGGPDVSLSYTLFDFGQRTARTTAAREALYYADLSHNQEIQNLLQTVMDDYYAYVYQEALMEADDASLKNAQMSLEAANQRFSLGLTSLGDVAAARTQFLQRKIRSATQKQTVQKAFVKLAVDCGLPPNASFSVQPIPEQLNVDPILEDVNTLIGIAQNKRQDLLASQANLRSKEALLSEAKRAQNPILSTELNTGHYWFQKGRQEHSMHWSASFSLNFPIFDGFYLKNGVRNAEANLESSKADLYETELSILQGVTNAHIGVRTASENLSDAKEYLKAATLEFKIAMENYKAGINTMLDLISAQSSLADARERKARTEQDWFSSLASLAHATGSLSTNSNMCDACID